ncbi:MAG: histidine kinase [Epsilonproteobacteria bacterium]|nr:MAG: histidine kinase [Campylobacterota bacterium]
MRLKYNEEKLIKLIKIVPIVLVIIFSIVTTYIILNNKIYEHKKELNNIKETFITNKKDIVKNEVLRVVRQINYHKNLSESNLRKSLKFKVNTANKIILSIYKENQLKTKSELIKMIKDAIKPIRFNNGRGYFFIYTMKGKNILLPSSPKMQGKNFWNHKDSKGVYVIRKLSKISKLKGEGFFNWHWYKPQDKTKMYKKIGFVKYIKELNCFIGTGEYIKDFEKTIQDKIINEVQQIRYGKNGYIFMHKYDGVCLSHIKKKNIGKNRLETKDKNGNLVVRDIINFAKSGGGFMEYMGTINPSTGLPARKISFIYGMDDWKWQIGAGNYVNDIDAVLIQKNLEFNKTLNKIIFIVIFSSLLLTLILVFALFKFSNSLAKEFKNYKVSLDKEIEENKKKDKLINEQSKMASMGEMIGNIAHQWRQPLSVISTASTGMKMQKNFGTLNDELFNQSCTAINNNAQYLSKTIDDFKNFIKDDRIKKVFILKDDINSFLNLVEGSIKSNNINMILNLQEDIKIDGYENELTQCFINIFNNAKDILKEHNNQDDRFIFISTSTNKNNVIITIKDNAGGIPKDILPKIFEPYFTTKHQSQGTGLGLHMTYNLIVDGMGGTIEAENVIYKYNSKEFAGAEFTISLPMG